MRTLAYCAESYREATRRAAGVEPLTCPPLEASVFDARWLDGHDLLYFDLHGKPDADYWQGDGGLTALWAAQVRAADLRGAVVFATSCYLEADGLMVVAFLDAGARCVIGGGGRNYGGRRTVLGAALLGLWLRRGLQWGLGLERALELARRRVALAAAMGRNRAAARDALEFRVYHGRPA